MQTPSNIGQTTPVVVQKEPHERGFPFPLVIGREHTAIPDIDPFQLNLNPSELLDAFLTI
jgi:hypothetical protein